MAFAAAVAGSPLVRSSFMVPSLASIAKTVVLVGHFAAGGDCMSLLVAQGVVKALVVLVLFAMLPGQDEGSMLHLCPSDPLTW